MRTVIALAATIALAGSGVTAIADRASAAPSTPSPITQAGTSAVKGSAKDKYQVYSRTDETVRYTRTYAGLRVYGGDLAIRLKNGKVTGTSVGLRAPLSLSTTPAVPAATALRVSRAHFTGRITSTGRPELFVDASTGLGKLAWETVVSGWLPDGQTPSRLHVITDAGTGAPIGSFDEIESVAGTGNSIYSGPVAIETTATGTGFTLTDPTRGAGYTCDMGNRTSGSCAVLTDTDNVWGTGTNTDRASAAVDAHFGAATTFDYFKNVHGRDGIFGDGTGVPSRVHYGSAYVNAFWDGAQMTYGDGTGNAKPLVALDVAGHEMSHGVTEHVVPGGLTYSGEPGGLNEATSDIFGSMVEFYAGSTTDPGDYDIGEKIDIRGTGAPLRYMYNPVLDGSSHGCWSSSTKNVDVHYSSGVANHFFFDLAEGSGATEFGTSPLCGTAAPVIGIGRDKASAIWFRALDNYFISSTTYAQARGYTLAAATDLYGFCSTEYKAVQASWTAVNVAGDDFCSAGNDFSLRLGTVSLTVDPGTSGTVTLATTSVNGEAEPITFSAGVVPAGVTVSFDPPTVTAGDPTTVTVTAAPGAARASAPVTITGTAPAVTRAVSLTVGVNSAAACTATNGDDLAIPDNTTVFNSVTIDGCATAPSATSSVEVHIEHTYIGDLIVTLLAPDGSPYVLHNRAGGSTDNIDETYTVNLSGESANGTWTLSVRDAASADIGTLDTWSLSL
ncbi:M4 family metallopeptidase [Paractinoplanes ferrugineus]|uniref:M4 family metallopeptidase n=1 Tax=Paractinoplanes ferrugineus TaxID=113564 RepID=UPI001EF28374|nr:M4 family metallopeptidase [Actinoplanes ferrugineus]